MESSAPSPTVSIVTTVLRADPRHFRVTAQSVAAQTFTDFEWIVVEDPPHGCVADVLAGAGIARVDHMRAPRPSSLAAARNVAIARARGQLIAILDADDECASERLARQVAAFTAEPGLAVVGSAIEVVDEDGRRLGFRAHPAADAAIRAAMRRFNPLAHPSVMLRREAIEAVGGYRDLGEGACDDYDLWSRIARAGGRFRNLPQALLRYRVHGGAMKARRLRATLRDTLRVKREHWSAELTLGDRMRMLGERALLLLPPPLVMRLFLGSALRRELPAADGA